MGSLRRQVTHPGVLLAVIFIAVFAVPTTLTIAAVMLL